MTQDHLTEPFDDELFSAYIDDELTGEELARVEQRLANDPEARQLVDELRALSQEVQSLPKATIGEDLRAAVMQRAEREMLIGGKKDQPALPPAESSSSSQRRWLWAAMALAATLLLSIYLPSKPQEDQEIASVKPVPGNKLRSKMEIRAAEPELQKTLADEIAVAEQSVEQPSEGLQAGEPFELADTPRMRARSAISEPQAAAPHMAEKVTTDVKDKLCCQVHVTLNDQAEGLKKFDQFLAASGIDLKESEQAEKLTADREGQSVPEEGDAEAREFATKDLQLQRLQAGQKATQAELVLVEDSPKQIENVIDACNIDTFTCPTVRVVAGKASPLVPLERWQRLSRDEKKVNRSELKQAESRRSFANNSPPGRATRLPANWYSYQPKNKHSYFGALRSAQTASSNPPVQVLFILQQALGEPKSGEPVSADGPPLKVVTPQR